MPAVEADPRVVAAGGTPIRGGKGGWRFPGMMDASNWRKTSVHKSTHYYGCAFCSQRFTAPDAVYVHLAKVHPRKGTQPGGMAARAGRVRSSRRVPVGTGASA